MDGGLAGLFGAGDSNAVWIVFDADDTPLWLELGVGTTLPVFHRLSDVRGWLEESGRKEGMEPKLIPPAGVVLLCDDYAPQVDYFAWIGPDEAAALRNYGEHMVMTLALWQLKMWAQYVSGDPGYVETAKREAV